MECRKEGKGYSLLSDGLGGVFSNFHPVSIFLSGGVPSVPFSSWWELSWPQCMIGTSLLICKANFLVIRAQWAKCYIQDSKDPPLFPSFFHCLQDTGHPKMCGFLSVWKAKGPVSCHVACASLSPLISTTCLPRYFQLASLKVPMTEKLWLLLGKWTF